MTRFEVPGAVLDVSLSDEGGPAVMQLHGLTSSRVRDQVLDLDLGRGLSGTRLLRYDARGHGASTGRTEPRDYVWENLADDLLAVLDHWFPGEPVHGVGPSMGSATLLHAAVRDPSRFSALTLLVPPTAWATRIAKAAEYRASADLIERQGVDAFIAACRLGTPPPAAADHPETVPDVPQDLLPSVFRGAALSDLPSPEALAALKVKTSILAWVDDPSHPVSTAQRLTELIDGSSLEVAQNPADVAGWPALLAADVAASSR